LLEPAGVVATTGGTRAGVFGTYARPKSIRLKTSVCWTGAVPPAGPTCRVQLVSTVFGGKQLSALQAWYLNRAGSVTGPGFRSFPMGTRAPPTTWPSQTDS